MDETPAYNQIADILRRSIASQSLPAGQVLLEGPLATLFGSSRSPIRQALNQLEQEGLLARFGGRGLVVGDPGAPLIRATPTAGQLGLAGAELTREPVWRRIYDRVERDLIHASVLDPGRINEVELARHYNIGRSVAGQVLLRAEANGIVRRDAAGRWSTVLLDRERVFNLYKVRSLLEPEAMAEAASGGRDRDRLSRMHDALLDALARYPEVPAGQLDALETDLHVDLVEGGRNPELARALHHTRCTIIISKHALGGSVSYPSDDPFIVEHLRIVEAILARNPTAARQAMKEHLASAASKVADRIDRLRPIAGSSAPIFLQSAQERG